MAKVDASHALTISAHTNLGTSPIVEFGTKAQRDRYVPLLASGRVLGGFGLTEPGAGSDAGGTATAAVDKPGNGSRGITSFIVTKDTVDLDRAKALGVGHAADLPKTKGVRAGKKQDKMGWRASDTRELIFENAVVPKENVLGQLGQGFVNLGIAEGAYDEALRYAGERKQFGRAIGSFQGVSFQLADMATEIEAGTHLLYHAAWLKQNGRPFKKEAAMAKLFCSELAMRATTKAVQIFGGYGYTTEYPVERMMRDAKVCEIGEGTSEIQRIVIARQILGDLAG